MNPEEYGRLPLRPQGLYSGDHLYYDRRTRSVKRLPGHLAALVGDLLPWGTLNEHLEHLQGATGAEAEDLKESFAELVSAGVLITKTEFFSLIRQTPPTRPTEGTSRITSFVCCTRNRPDALVRCLDSFAKSLNDEGTKDIRFLVFDDSDHGETELRCRGVVSDLARRNPGIPFLYAGKDEKNAFIRGIRDEIGELPEGLLDFALFGGCGANRNASLLFTAGECILSTDDDTQGLFAPPPVPVKNGFEINTRFDPTVYRIFRDRVEIAAGVPLSPARVADHEMYLGRTIASLADGLGNPEGLGLPGCGPELTEQVLRRGGRVVLTAAGIVGDSAMGSARAALLYRGGSREALLSGAGYSFNKLFRDVHRAAARPTLSRGDHFMAAHFGLDTRRIVPPFFPRYRNSDGVFAAMLTAQSPSAFICHLPLSVFHDPTEVRANPPDSLTTWRPRVSELLCFLAKNCPSPPGMVDETEKIRNFGEYLTALAGLEAEEFRRLIARGFLPSAADYLDSLYKILDDYNGEPAEWADDVSAMIEYIESNIEDPMFLVPLEIREESGEGPEGNEKAVRDFQKLLGRYGELLTWWPAIWSAALKINRRRI